MSYQYTFDDGSTIGASDDWQYTSATPALYSVNAGPDFSANAVNPNASSWDDVLKFGISRTVDAYTRTVQPVNAAPVLTRTPTISYVPGAGLPGMGISSTGLLLIGAVLLFALASK